MDTLTFIVELLKAFAWPIVIVILIAMLRKPIAQLIPLLHRLKYKGLELEFSKEVFKLADQVERDVPMLHERNHKEWGDDQLLTFKAQHSPRTAILEAWLKLENVAIDTLRRKRPDFTKASFISPRYITNSLQKAEVLDKKQISIFNKLRRLRNMAVHSLDFNLDLDAVAEFVYLTEMFINHIQGA